MVKLCTSKVIKTGQPCRQYRTEVKIATLESDCLGHIREHFCLWQGSGHKEGQLVFTNPRWSLLPDFPFYLLAIQREALQKRDLPGWGGDRRHSPEEQVVGGVSPMATSGPHEASSGTAGKAQEHRVIISHWTQWGADYGPFKAPCDIQLRVPHFPVTKFQSLTQDSGPRPLTLEESWRQDINGWFSQRDHTMWY